MDEGGEVVKHTVMIKAAVLAESICHTRLAVQTLSGASSRRSDDTNHGQYILDAFRLFYHLELATIPGLSSAALPSVRPSSYQEGEARSPRYLKMSERCFFTNTMAQLVHQLEKY